jgi:hypothetical protein
MATTGLAASKGSSFDATTPTKASSLSPDVAGKLLVNLDREVAALKESKDFDLEGLMTFQRVANYL